MPQKQVSVINQEILDNNMPSTLITFTPNPTHYACIFIMYLDVFARFLRLLSRVFEMRKSIYLSCTKLIIMTRMFISACETPCIKKYQAP